MTRVRAKHTQKGGNHSFYSQGIHASFPFLKYGSCSLIYPLPVQARFCKRGNHANNQRDYFTLEFNLYQLAQ